ncbi:uncharacterized protein LOC129743549 [Uranotaenia lowii]|uniref:uncharacterized protein LOC129743549 n=1 Tax=Uranotaenia lowii TaxID=190385 RepID=UPI002479885D|nr:uncharacterized protein LOC129743549 [Uranotaenia lowii]
MDDSIICIVCQKKEEDSSQVLTCAYCFSCAHFRCKNIIGNAIGRWKKKLYYCTPECSVIYQRVIDMQNNNIIDTLGSQLKSITIKEMENVKAEVRLVTSAIESSQEFLSAKIDSINADFNELKLENQTMKHEMEILKQSHSALEETVRKLEASVDMSARFATSKNLVFLGLPVIENENVPDLIVKTLATIGVEARVDSFTLAERFFPPGKNKKAIIPIRVIFKSTECKELVMSKKGKFGKLLSTSVHPSLNIDGKSLTVSIRDELTPLALDLLKETRESQDILEFKYVWPGRSGVVLAKKDEASKPEIIKNKSDLIKLTKNALAQQKTDQSNQTSPDIVQENKRKKRI